jgi:hypothetical protein
VRRRAFLFSTLAVACGAKHESPEAPRSPTVTSLQQLLVAPRLEWLIEAKPKQMHLELFAKLLTPARFAAFQSRFGFDLRAAEEAVCASYRDGLLWGARSFVQPASVEGAFTKRAQAIARRSHTGGVLTLEGVVRGEPASVACVGNDAVLFEERMTGGAFRAALLLAQGRLQRTKPACTQEPLLRLSNLLGDAEFRAMAPGPFSDAWVHAASDLLTSATSVGLTVRVKDRRLVCALCITGVAERDPEGAKSRILATFDQLVSSDVGRTARLDRADPHARAEGDVLWLEFSYDAERFSEGLYLLLDSNTEELFAH